MPKNIEDIIVPEKKKSIRDIPIPENRRKPLNVINAVHATEPVAHAPNPSSTPAPTADTPTPPEPPRPPYRDYMSHKRPRGFFRKGTILGMGAGLIVVVVVILSIFSGATLAYTPKSLSLNFEAESYTANKTGETGLLYSVVKLSLDKGQSVAASGQEQVERKASGTIVVYNNVSSATQRLIATTRFESEDGKVYRTPTDLTIPGQKTVEGVVQPGSLEVTVYADEAGESFNIGLTDFTLPGLEGSSNFSKIYARSKSPMTGGFVGLAKQVSPANLSSAKATLETELEAGLMEQARAQVPGDFILIPALSMITYEDLPQSDVQEDSVTVNLRGNLTGVMFKKTDLSRYLATRKTTLALSDTVSMQDFESLSFSFSGEAPADLLQSDQINFLVSGSSLLVWQTDEDMLKGDLAGRTRDDVQSVVNNYPSISNADVTIRPFWKSSFPSDASKISVKKLSAE